MAALSDRIETYRGTHILCAVSGGVDSIALLIILSDARSACDIQLSAAHFEHQIRGEDSLADARFVKELCARYEIPLEIGTADIPALAQEKNKGIEEMARDERYRFLREQKAKINADYIALAHHADDQMETVLMHLLRGSGLTGVCGMRPRDGDLIRPLLDVYKYELIRFVKSRSETWREDQTNLIADTPRNILRLRAIPALCEAYPGCVDAVNRFGIIAQEEDRYMDAAARTWLDGRLRTMPFGWALDLDDQVHIALVLRALHTLLPGCGYDSVRAAANLTMHKMGAIELPGKIRIERGEKRLYYIRPDFEKNEEIHPLVDGARLNGVGGVSVRPSPPVPVTDDLYRQVVDASALEGSCVRTRRDGDRVQPFGMSKTKRLSDMLIDCKIDRAIRDSLLLIAKGDEVLWIAGVGISEKLRLKKNRSALQILFIGDKLLP